MLCVGESLRHPPNIPRDMSMYNDRGPSFATSNDSEKSVQRICADSSQSRLFALFSRPGLCDSSPPCDGRPPALTSWCFWTVPYVHQWGCEIVKWGGEISSPTLKSRPIGGWLVYVMVTEEIRQRIPFYFVQCEAAASDSLFNRHLFDILLPPPHYITLLLLSSYNPLAAYVVYLGPFLSVRWGGGSW